MQPEEKVDWKDLEYQVVFRRVLDHILLEAQRSKKKQARKGLRQLLVLNAGLKKTVGQQAQVIASLQQTIEQQAKASAALQQTIDRQAQLVEQNGIVSRQISDGFVTSRLRTPSKRKNVLSPVSIPAPLVAVPESPQTQLAGSMSQMAVKSLPPSPMVSPSRIPGPTAFRARVNCLGSPGIGATAKKESSEGKAAKADSRQVDTGAKLEIQGTATGSDVALGKTERKTVGPRNGIVRIHFGDVLEKPGHCGGAPKMALY